MVLTKKQIIAMILAGKSQQIAKSQGKVYAPANIALCKYWGKRNSELNLPMTASLSISLAQKGSHFAYQVIDAKEDSLFLNDQAILSNHDFYQRLFSFIDLFRQDAYPKLQLRIDSTIPIAAGLASSASGFASVVEGLNELFGWQLQQRELSILARLGSGSACRSLWHGFVEWQLGIQEDGMDSHGVVLDCKWPEFHIGLLLASKEKKSISSREAMAITKQTSLLYHMWPQQVAHDLQEIKQGLKEKNFSVLGAASERNALAMHATMLAATPTICYSTPQTLAWMQQVWQLRRDGVATYFTQDAGPNLKLLFLEKDLPTIMQAFPEVEIIRPFLQVGK